MHAVPQEISAVMMEKGSVRVEMPAVTAEMASLLWYLLSFYADLLPLTIELHS